jgi:hypothetical protein
MYHRTLLIATILVLSACGTSPSTTTPGATQPGNPGQERRVSAAEVMAVPSSIPLLTLRNGYNHGPASPSQVHFETQTELDRFIAEHPGTIGDDFASTDPGPAIVSDEWSPVVVYGKVDFAKYEAVLFHGKTFNLTGNARIVTIEDQPSRLIVHTARWLLPSDPPEASADMPVYHFVAFPRTDKPVVFAPTMAVVSGTKTTVAQGSDAGRAVYENASPHWRAVPNPELTREKVESMVRHMLGSEPHSLILEKRALQWLGDNLHMSSSLGNLSANSEMWVAIAEGQFSHEAFSGPIGGVGVTKPSGVSRVTYAISIEDGMVLGTVAKPL